MKMKSTNFSVINLKTNFKMSYQPKFHLPSCKNNLIYRESNNTFEKF